MNQAKKKIIFIVSSPYSGSTLLALILGNHPDVVTIGERKRFYGRVAAPDGRGSSVCSCGKLFSDCEFWKDIVREWRSRWETGLPTTNFTLFAFFRSYRLNRTYRDFLVEAIVRGRLRMVPGVVRRRFDLILGANRSLIEAIMRTGQATVYLDSSKPVRHAVFLSVLPDYQLFVVNLVRDPRGQVCSTIKYRPELSLQAAASRWAKETELNKSLLVRSSIRHIDLRYEDLCADPRGVTERILSFVELEPHPEILDFRRREMHIIGNDALRMGKETAIVERKEWQQKLSAEDLRTIAAIAGETARRFGYTLG